MLDGVLGSLIEFYNGFLLALVVVYKIYFREFHQKILLMFLMQQFVDGYPYNIFVQFDRQVGTQRELFILQRDIRALFCQERPHHIVLDFLRTARNT